MLGLIIKDLFTLKKQLGALLFIGAFYIVFSLMSQNTAILGGVAAILTATLPMTSAAFDEKSGWDKYAATMPVSRSLMVISKYVLGLSLAAVMLLITAVIMLAFGKTPLNEVALLSLIFFGISIFLQCIFIPLIIRFGVEKSRLAMVAVALLPTMAVMLLERVGITNFHFLFDILPYVLPIVLVVVWVASLTLSIRIFSRKDLI